MSIKGGDVAVAKNVPLVPSAQPGSMAESPAGLTWKEQYPVVADACNLCLDCTLFCPEGAIIVSTNKVSVNLQFCKGCGICATECKQGAISMNPQFSGESGIFPVKGVNS